MSTFCKSDRKLEGWSLVVGRFKGTSKDYFYVVRGNLLCGLPLTLQCPASEDGYVYSNPFTIEHKLVRFGPHIDQETMLNLGHHLPSKRELRVLVGDELRDVTADYSRFNIVLENAGPKLKEALKAWENVSKCKAAIDEVVVTVKNAGGIKTMNTGCSCKNEGVSALKEVLFYWHDEVHDRIGEIIGEETLVVRETSAKKAFVEQMAAQIVEFERQGNDDKWDAEARARRNDRLCSLLTDWVEVPKAEADQVIELDRILKGARARLEAEFESLFVRAKIVPVGSETEWLGAVGIYGKDGLNFDIEADARRFIREVSAKV